MKTQEKHLHNLSQIPQSSRKIMAAHNETISRAFQKPGKLARHFAGLYFVVIDGELVELEQLDEGPASGEWIAREASPTGAKWFSDPFPTLKSLKQTLGL